MDDAVRRGRMTRDDANELVSNLITRGRGYTDDLVKELERLLDQARRELESRTRPDAPPRHPGRRSSRARGARRRGHAAGPGRSPAPAGGVSAGGPITAYDQLTASQIKSRLGDLSPAELRQLRDAREARQGAQGRARARSTRRLK